VPTVFKQGLDLQCKARAMVTQSRLQLSREAASNAHVRSPWIRGGAAFVSCYSAARTVVVHVVVLCQNQGFGLGAPAVALIARVVEHLLSNFALAAGPTAPIHSGSAASCPGAQSVHVCKVAVVCAQERGLH